MSLKEIARQTLAICESGNYQAPSGAKVDIHADVQAAVRGTALYRPDELAAALAAEPVSRPRAGAPVKIAVTEETTQVAAHRLVGSEGADHLVLLNFASARNPGGGFIRGAKAQEEDVARCCALYPCLTKAEVWPYYEVNRATESLLYTDHIIYSPAVPFFRTRSRNIIERPFRASIITAPAPNAGEVLRRDPAAGPAIEAALRQRAGMVLAIAEARVHRTLLLGAWGCGVFANRPEQVADAFSRWLQSDRFADAFDRVVFAIYDRTKDRRVHSAFAAHYAASGQ